MGTTQVIDYTTYLAIRDDMYQCTIVIGGERHVKQPLHPIPVQRPFLIIVLNMMDLPVTDQGN